MTKYLRLYQLLAIHNFSSLVASRLDFFTLILGKLIRIGFLFVFIWSIFYFIKDLAGYNFGQTLLFFATFNLLDILAQALFFRGFWFIQEWVRTGELDRLLTYPVNLVFIMCFKITDFMDIVTLIPALGLLIFAIFNLGIIPSWQGIILYVILCFNGLSIAFSLNLIISSAAFFTTRTENLFLLYRDLMTVGRYPTEIFNKNLRFLFTFVLPIAVIIAFPAKVLMGMLSVQNILTAFLMSLVFFAFAKKLFDFSLKYYQSVG